jgi:hypothetical protein
MKGMIAPFVGSQQAGSNWRERSTNAGRGHAERLEIGHSEALTQDFDFVELNGAA